MPRGRGLGTLPTQQASLRLCPEEPQFTLFPLKSSARPTPRPGCKGKVGMVSVWEWVAKGSRLQGPGRQVAPKLRSLGTVTTLSVSRSGRAQTKSRSCEGPLQSGQAARSLLPALQGCLPWCWSSGQWPPRSEAPFLQRSCVVVDTALGPRPVSQPGPLRPRPPAGACSSLGSGLIRPPGGWGDGVGGWRTAPCCSFSRGWSAFSQDESAGLNRSVFSGAVTIQAPSLSPETLGTRWNLGADFRKI